jgi:hypothetical protein
MATVDWSSAEILGRGEAGAVEATKEGRAHQAAGPSRSCPRLARRPRADRARNGPSGAEAPARRRTGPADGAARSTGRRRARAEHGLQGARWCRKSRRLPAGEDELSASMEFPPESSPAKRKQKGNGHTVADSYKQRHYSAENNEIYLCVVVVDAGIQRCDRKMSPESSSET